MGREKGEVAAAKGPTKECSSQDIDKEAGKEKVEEGMAIDPMGGLVVGVGRLPTGPPRAVDRRRRPEP